MEFSESYETKRRYSIEHATMLALEKFGLLVKEQEEEDKLQTSKDEEECNLGKRDPKRQGYYVCQNLWVFLSHPPCVMCSMALTHSRIQTLYYIAKDSSSGKNLDICGTPNLVCGCQPPGE